MWGGENWINLYGALELVIKNLELISCFDTCLGNEEKKVE